MTRILITAGRTEIAAPQGAIVAIARHLTTRGYRVSMMTAAAPREAATLVRGMSLRPDAILAFVPPLAPALHARALASRIRVPYAAICAPSALPESPGKAARLEQFVLAFAARAASIVAVSTEEQRRALERAGVSPDRMRRAPRWSRLPVAEADPALVRQRLRLPDDATFALYAGPLLPGIGLENVVHAARIAQHRHPSWRFVLAGEGPRRAVLRDMLAWYGITNTTLTRPLPREMLAAADVLVAPATDPANVMSAYFAAGCPIVATAPRDGEVAREITASSAGIVAGPDPSSMVRAIERISGDGALKMYLTRAARSWAVTQRSESRAMHGFEQIVAAVLARGTHGRVHAPIALPAFDGSTRAARRAA